MPVAAAVRQRGTAFVETMMMLSFVLLLFYSIVQTGITAYSQVSADGATFVGTHTAVQYRPDGTGDAASIAENVAHAVFQGIGKTTVSILHPTSTTFETDVTVANGSFGLAGPGSATTSRQIDSSTDPGDTANSTQFPQAGTTMCLANKVDVTTGTLSKTPIAGYTPGTLAQVGPTAANSIDGSLSITPQSFGATFGTQQSALGAVAAANARLSGDLSTISAAVAALANDPVVGPTIEKSIGVPPVAGQNVPVDPTTIDGELSGGTGLVARAASGVLTSSKLAAVQAQISAVTTALDALPQLPAVTSPVASQILALATALTDVGPQLGALNGGEAEIDALDAKVATTVCP